MNQAFSKIRNQLYKKACLIYSIKVCHFAMKDPVVIIKFIGLYFIKLNSTVKFSYVSRMIRYVQPSRSSSESFQIGRMYKQTKSVLKIKLSNFLPKNLAPLSLPKCICVN